MNARFDHKSLYLLTRARAFALRFLNFFSFHAFCDSFFRQIYINIIQDLYLYKRCINDARVIPANGPQHRTESCAGCLCHKREFIPRAKCDVSPGFSHPRSRRMTLVSKGLALVIFFPLDSVASMSPRQSDRACSTRPLYTPCRAVGGWWWRRW